MTRLGWWRLAATMAGAAAVVWAVMLLLVRGGASLPATPLAAALALLACAALVLWLAWAVRQYKAGKRPGLDALRAARTAALAQAASIAGALAAGGYGGLALALATEWEQPMRRDAAIAALVAAAAALVLLVAGRIGESWCSASGGDGTSAPGKRSSAPAT